LRSPEIFLRFAEIHDADSTRHDSTYKHLFSHLTPSLFLAITMGVSLSTAQVLAPLSFAVDFGAQLYGMLSGPNMKQIHDRNIAAFSPYGNMIGYFFFPQQLLQLWWLRRLWTNPENEQVKYVPYYALGNFCIAGWMFFWVPCSPSPLLPLQRPPIVKKWTDLWEKEFRIVWSESGSCYVEYVFSTILCDVYTLATNAR